MQLNCHTGLVNGIAGITKKWLITYTFPLLTLLYPIFPCSVCLNLGQRRSCLCLCVPCITPVIIAFNRHLLLSQLIGTPALLLSYSNSLLLSHIVLLSHYPHWYRLIVSIVYTSYLPSLGG